MNSVVQWESTDSQSQLRFKTKGRKSVAGSFAHQSSLRRNLARDTLSQPGSFIGVSGLPLTVLH